jgi:iron(III) transport system substrate-binding protein
MKGAPLDYVKGLPAYLGDGNFIGLTTKAPHPNAAKLYIDYFLGQESMEIMAKVGEFVNRRGVYPPISGAEQVVGKFVQMIEMSADDYSRKKEEYRQTFRRTN